MSALKKCKKNDCGNMALRASDFCGTHIPLEELQELLGAISEQGSYTGLELSYVVLNNFEWIGKTNQKLTLQFPTFRECSFTNVRFENIIFANTDVNSLVTNQFDECQFINCEFKDIEIEDCNFVGCTFQKVKFDGCKINQSAFNYETSFQHSEIYLTKFTGCSFDNLPNIIDLRLNMVDFIYCEWSKLIVKNSHFQDVTFAHTRIYNSWFEQVKWATIVHDYQTTERFRLCRLIDCELEQVDLPDTFEDWNTFSEAPLAFHTRLVEQISAKPTIALLSDLNEVIQHIASH